MNYSRKTQCIGRIGETANSFISHERFYNGLYNEDNIEKAKDLRKIFRDYPIKHSYFNIPHVSHSLWIERRNNSTGYERKYLEILKNNLQILLGIDSHWIHFFWADCLHVELENMLLTLKYTFPNIFIKNLCDLDLQLDRYIIKDIAEIKDRTVDFILISDTMRLIVLKHLGGVYFDNDYKFIHYKTAPQKIDYLMHKYDFIGFDDSDVVHQYDLYNNLIMSKPYHKVVALAIDISIFNVNHWSNLEYNVLELRDIRYIHIQNESIINIDHLLCPCDYFSKVISSTARPMTKAFIQECNLDTDVILKQKQVIEDKEINPHGAIIGRDYYSGSWTQDIHYSPYCIIKLTSDTFENTGFID